jgi:ribosomal protein S18 acetylase RimI-like enzyme
MLIRKLTPEDAAAYRALRLQALRECPTAFASSEEEELGIPLLVVGANLAADEGACVLGAFDDAALVGVVGLQREQPRKLAHKAFVWGVYVAPQSRRQGLGRELMMEALAQAAAMPGVRQVNLSVNAANAPAMALYRAMGFEPFGTERGFMMLDGELLDETHMACVLGPVNAIGGPT